MLSLFRTRASVSEDYKFEDDVLVTTARTLRRLKLKKIEPDQRIPEEDRADLESGLVLLNTYIFQLCTSESDSIREARWVGEKTLDAFFQKLYAVKSDKEFKSRVANAIWGPGGIRFWLFKAVKGLFETVRKNPEILINPNPDSPFAFWEKDMRFASALSSRSKRPTDCSILSGRKSFWRRRTGFCGRSCDLLLFHRLKFSQRELAEALNTSDSTIGRYLSDCEEREIDRRLAAKKQPTGTHEVEK